jgi:hypothetical protein
VNIISIKNTLSLLSAHLSPLFPSLAPHPQHSISPSSNPNRRKRKLSDGLAILEKKTISVDLFCLLRNFIAFNYSEREAQNLDDNLQTLKQLRSNVERQSDPTPIARRDLLQNYFKALCLVETRFPISSSRGTSRLEGVDFAGTPSIPPTP